MAKILEVKGLSAQFGSKENLVEAVKQISFDLFRGEILGVVGESGSGKSVTMLSLLKLIPSNRVNLDGEIWFNEQDLAALSGEEIRKYRGSKFSMIFQEPMSSLNPTMRLGDQVMEMVALHTDYKGQEAKDYILGLFEKVLLPNPERIYKAYPHEASGGQLQRVMIAMAISSKPEVLIADEPTTALDVTVQKEILELIKNIQKEMNTSTIFISHDLHVIKNICDRVVVMKDGNIVEQGTVDQIFSHPKEDYTKGLIACRPQSNFNLNRLPTVKDFISDSVSKVPKKIANISAHKVLEVKSLKKYFPAKKNWYGKVIAHTKAVDDVSFSLHQGEILGLVGESGCGKSTLGKLVSRLIESDSGSIVYEGKSILELEGDDLRSYRKEVQMIFQDPYGSLNPRMKIGEAILEPMLSHGILGRKEGKQRVLALLEKTGLKVEHYNRYPHEFSGGQRQRISIARALSLNPQLLICDESISALDVSVQAQIINLLLDLREDMNLSILFIAHDLAAVRFISDRVAVMHQGKIVELGKAQQVYESPQAAYTKRLLSAIEI